MTTEKRNCTICGKHYDHWLHPDMSDQWLPACDCEAKAERARREQGAVEQARGPLDTTFRAIGEEMRAVREEGHGSGM